jgi:cell shape-determining protein MreC
MNYLRTNKRPSERRARTVAIVIGGIVIVVAAIQLLAPRFFPALASGFAVPFWRTEFALDSGAAESPAALLNENESLKRQIASDAVRLETVQATEDENADLKALMGRASTTPYVLAAVLSRPPAAPYDELIIDIGEDHGLSTTSLVYAPGDVLVGRVSDVLSQSAKVTLLSSPGQKYDVLIGADHIPATAVGRGGGQYEADLPQAAQVSEGDVVTDPSLDDRAFGIVASVSSDPADPFETALFAPPVDIYQLRWVLIDVKGK